MDIRGFLNRSNKIRDLSSGSKEDSQPKRQKEESPDVPCIDSPRTWKKKNLEKEAKELNDLASSNNAYQIKGERQLLDLKYTVDFISNKFDDFERDRLEKKKIMKDLK